MNGFLVAVGIGNTTVKIGVVAESGLESDSQPKWLVRAELPTAGLDAAALEHLVRVSPCRWLVASVQRAAEQTLRDWVSRSRPLDEHQVLTYRHLPIEVDVERPERVGLDRLAAAVAANRLRASDRAALVVDAGTAITVNLVTADGVFRGGVILPGFKLTAQALAQGTDLLPFVAVDGTADPPAIVGRSTEEAIRSGLFWGSVGAVRELLHRISADLAVPPQVFVTGGDAQRLAGFITPDARFIPDLVLIGIVNCHSCWRGSA